jgi:ketosteroid isomerase-like protein
MTDMVKLMRQWLDVVAKGPAEAWPALAVDDVVIRLPYAPAGVADELRGQAEAVRAMSPVWQAKERFDWHDVVILRTEDPDLLVTTARSEVVYSSGQRYANSYVILTRFRDGKVVEHVEYFNPLPVLALLGAAADASGAQGASETAA